jgi:hypothetical protein
LKRNTDGGVTIYLQARSPGGDEESNWLPCPTGGAWFVILRMYRPHHEVVEAAWECPGLRRVG